VIALYERSQDQKDDAERHRREIQSRLERIAELYKWGDMTREAYTAERGELQAELSALKGRSDFAEVLARTAQYLRDLPTAWASATPAQRNALARQVFRAIEVTDDRVAAYVVNPDFAPFFVANQNTPDLPGCQGSDQPGGSDGTRTRDLSLDRAAC